MVGHLEVDELASAVAYEEEDVEGLEGESLDDEEVGGSHHFERDWPGTCASFGWVGGNDGVGDIGGSSTS